MKLVSLLNKNNIILWIILCINTNFANANFSIPIATIESSLNQNNRSPAYINSFNNSYFSTKIRPFPYGLRELSELNLNCTYSMDNNVFSALSVNGLAFDLYSRLNLDLSSGIRISDMLAFSATATAYREYFKDFGYSFNINGSATALLTLPNDIKFGFAIIDFVGKDKPNSTFHQRRKILIGAGYPIFDSFQFDWTTAIVQNGYWHNTFSIHYSYSEIIESMFSLSVNPTIINSHFAAKIDDNRKLISEISLHNYLGWVFGLGIINSF